MSGPDRSFPRSARIRRPADFKQVFQAGRRAGTRCFRGWFLPHADGLQSPSGPRLGLAISRRVDARAVERNRIKRLIREWFRLRRSELTPGDLVISGKPAASQGDAQRLLRELDLLAARLGLKPDGQGGTMPGSSEPSIQGSRPRSDHRRTAPRLAPHP